MTTKLDETLTIDQPQKEFMEQLVMPVIALRGLVVFPGMSVQFDVGRKKSILAVNQAMDINQTVFLVAQKDLETSDPKQEHLHKVGVIAKIKTSIPQHRRWTSFICRRNTPCGTAGYYAGHPFLIGRFGFD